MFSARIAGYALRGRGEAEAGVYQTRERLVMMIQPQHRQAVDLTVLVLLDNKDLYERVIKRFTTF